MGLIDTGITSIKATFNSILENTGAFTLSKLIEKGFPYSVYTQNLEHYKESVAWFTGEMLEPNSSDDVNQEAYPIRINPIAGTCLKHAYALYGESLDDGRPLVRPKFVLDDPKSQKEKAHAIEAVLNDIWSESFGREVLMENGITSQILGGSVLNFRYVPYMKHRKYPFRVERISPDCFVGIPEYDDPYRLNEAWIIKNIDWTVARQYGVKIAENEPAYWIEHWTKDYFEITINDNPVTYEVEDGEIKGAQKNIWGLIPMVYIPHIRAGNFYGMNNIDNLRGLVKEMNLRYADYGDAISADSHQVIAVRNVLGKLEIKSISGTIDVIDLGSSAGITGTESDPDIVEVRKPMASVAMEKFNGQLMEQYRRDASHPAVADGEDEGSQRSAATLVARMWPLTSHINTERHFASDGLNWFTKIMLVCLQKKANTFDNPVDIPDEFVTMRVKQVWNPILPKDRAEFMNELVNRASNDIGSLEHIIELSGDVEDPEEELEKILAWKDQLKGIETKAAQAVAKTTAENKEDSPSGVASKGAQNTSGAQKSEKKSKKE